MLEELKRNLKWRVSIDLILMKHSTVSNKLIYSLVSWEDGEWIKALYIPISIVDVKTLFPSHRKFWHCEIYFYYLDWKMKA